MFKILTILMGTHAAQFALPPVQPIQYYGPGWGGPPPYMGGPPPYAEVEPGWYGRRGMNGPWWGRDMDPESRGMMNQFRWQHGPYGERPRAPWQGRPWY